MTDIIERPELYGSRVLLADAIPMQEAQAHVFALEEINRKKPQVELPLRHFIADGCYVREIFMPAGLDVTGRIHKHEHIAIQVYGDITIFDHTGAYRMSGYNVFVSKPGAKRALRTHADTMFLTVHKLRQPIQEVTPEILAELEREYVAETMEEYQRYLAHENSPRFEVLP